MIYTFLAKRRFYEGAQLQDRNTETPKQSLRISHKDPNKDGAKVALVINGCVLWNFCMDFKSIFSIEMLWSILVIHLCTHPYVNISINPNIHIHCAVWHMRSLLCMVREKYFRVTPDTLLLITKSDCCSHNDTQLLE